ncbi:HpsJ family protein [Geitlerinema sp. PCC 9228]|jgi:parvulin-like peptidyl-prolyl isomerase|uniref:hormogonium polysaccharide biosynthesis protein HpsJ n=1 Tax=Geitlerinema sp. PCC 9228 TaxID=111611 RepID=UPI0008F9D06A|nr:HpsJ family protein [Geitlerinema sp. PCC 9228]
MSVIDSRQFAPIASRALKLTGILLILSAIVDFLVLPIPYQFLDRGWRINVVTQTVERGIIPMIGIALLLLGFWVADVYMGKPKPVKKYQDLRTWALILSSLLGLVYLLYVPMFLNDVRIQNKRTIQQIEQQSQQAEEQLGSEEFSQRLEQQQSQVRQQIQNLLQSEENFQQALENVPQEQAQRLQEFKENPNALDQFLQQQADNFRNRNLTQIREREQELKQENNTEALKNSIRIGFSSLLLAIAYIMVGWLGLKSVKSAPGASARTADSK